MNWKEKVKERTENLAQINKRLEEEIIEHKEKEHALKISEEKYRNLITTMEEGVWVIDRAGRTTFVNPKMATMLGYTEEEMIGKYVFSFMDEKMIPLAKERLLRKSQGISEQFEFPYLCKDGTQIDCLLETTPMYDSDDNFIGALRCITDISKIKANEAQLKATFEQNAIGIAHMNLDGNYKLMNHQYCDIVGYSEAELLKMNLKELLHPDELSRLENNLDRVNAGEDQLSTMECRYIRKDGAIIWVRGAVASVKDNTGKPYLIIAMIEDISPQKEAEDLVKAQNEEIQANFDQIAVGIVHVDLQGHYLSGKSTDM